MLLSSTHFASLLLAISYLLILTSAFDTECQPDEYFTDADTGKNNYTCKLCHAACKSCSEATETDCGKCQDGFFYKDATTCHLMCNSKNQYVDFNYKECRQCSKECKNGCIETSDNCNNCSAVEYYRPDTNKCESQCPQNFGYYADKDQSRCVPCPDRYCLNCIKEGKCTKCAVSYILDNTSGRCKFDNKSKLSDPQCGEFCRNCKSANECEICEPGYYVNGGKCQKCDDGCYHCIGGKDCTACFTNYTMAKNETQRYCASHANVFNVGRVGVWISVTLGALFLLLLFVYMVNKSRDIYRECAKPAKTEEVIPTDDRSLSQNQY